MPWRHRQEAPALVAVVTILARMSLFLSVTYLWSALVDAWSSLYIISIAQTRIKLVARSMMVLPTGSL